MEGYSVTEAASILGVPTERVWELLARGVLSGAPEGETGMRVYLQPRPAPAPPVADAGRPNGDGGAREPERELSPFRELLTEFRNLTERYGQALLALGEARGEVAALRSRVDLLEARMDLRLPMSAPTPRPAPMPQPASRSVAPAEESDVTADDEPDRAHDVDEDRQSRRRRHRRATENFAEALARAEDPTRPEILAPAETAAAMAVLRDDGETVGSDSSLPRELPAAEPIPMADEVGEPAPESGAPATAADEADRSDVVGDARQETESEPVPEPEPASEPELPSEPEPEPEVAESAEADPEPEPETPPDAESAPAAGQQPEREPVVAAESKPEPEREPEPAVAEVPEPAPARPVSEDAPAITWDPQRYSVDIGDPDWFVEEEPPPTTTVGEPGASEPAPAASEAGDDTVERAADPSEAAASALEAEETMLSLGTDPSEPPPSPAGVTDSGTGAEEMEVVGSQPPPEPPTAPAMPRALPGSRELDEALSALDALAGRSRPAERADPTTEATAERAWPAADRPSIRPANMRPGPLTRAAAEHPRLATTPASRAYRRLRRIFPG